MLTDLKQAPIIEDATFNPVMRSLLRNEPVVIKEVECAWIETGGTMYCNEEVHEAVATLVPVSHLCTEDIAKDAEVEDDNAYSRTPVMCTSFPYDKQVSLNDEHGDGLLDSLAILMRAGDVYAAHVFNGHADEIIMFDETDTLDDVMDTVFTMFAVTGSQGSL